MLSILSPANLARRSARNPWLTVGLWVVLVAAGIFSASSMETSDSYKITGTDSYKADRLLEQLHGKAPATETVIIQAPPGVRIDDARFRDFVTEFTRQARALTGTVTAIGNYYETGDESMVSADRATTILPVQINADSGNAMQKVKPLFDLVEHADAGGFTVLTVGNGSINHETTITAEEDLKSAEMVGLPVALLVLIFVFGAAVAAGVPVVLGLLGILVSVGVTAAISHVLNVSSVTVNMITMIGLAVGIDYTLFIVERFREERARGADRVEAIVTAGNTASRAVLFSGITVIIALAGLLIVPTENFRGIAIGAITVVLAAIAIALTLLPAVLALLGDRINWLHLPGRGVASVDGGSETGFFGRMTALVVRHPAIAAALSVGVLVAAALPVLGIKLGSAGLSSYPDRMETVRAYRVLDREFSAGRISPAQVAIGGDVNSPAVRQAVIRLRTALAGDPDFGDATPLEVDAAGSVAAFDVIVNGDPTERRARDAVERLRHDYIPAAFAGVDAEVHVSGNSANITDYVNTMSDYLPIVIAFVLMLSFVLLLMVFRSVVIPLKAIVMNLLSVGAAYGLVVLAFQHGYGASLLGFQKSDTIAAYLPVFLFAVLFGLSMDYHVFLLSRIQERFLATGDNTAAVSYGLRSTAHIITGAAAIMMVVFGGFAAGDLSEIQQTGFGLAIAVFLDATIVRSVLVPASMEMLGGWNWYLPSWLAWIPRINVEGAPVAAPRHAAPAGDGALEMAGAGGR